MELIFDKNILVKSIGSRTNSVWVNNERPLLVIYGYKSIDNGSVCSIKSPILKYKTIVEFS